MSKMDFYFSLCNAREGDLLVTAWPSTFNGSWVGDTFILRGGEWWHVNSERKITQKFLIDDLINTYSEDDWVIM